MLSDRANHPPDRLSGFIYKFNFSYAGRPNISALVSPHVSASHRLRFEMLCGTSVLYAAVHRLQPGPAERSREGELN